MHFPLRLHATVLRMVASGVGRTVNPTESLGTVTSSCPNAFDRVETNRRAVSSARTVARIILTTLSAPAKESSKQESGSLAKTSDWQIISR